MLARLKFLLLVPVAIAALVIYLDWSGDRRSGPLLSDLRTLPIESRGTPAGAGNLIGIETRLQPADYQSRQRLKMKFATYLEQAREAGLLTASTVVVLPEHVGTGLFALGEKPEVQQARTLRDAMQWMALSNPWDYLRALLDGHRRDDRRTEAVLLLKAERMAADYQAIFGELAREFGVTLVAGSIVLPEPRLDDGRLRSGDGPLRQVSLTFDPQGRPLGALQYKHALGRYEKRYSAGPDDPRTSLLDTAAGPLAVQLGCDAYRQAPPAGAALLAIPGAPEDALASCGVAPEPALPHVAVRTLGMPWNLLGSPRRAASQSHSQPVRISNLWLPAPQ